MDMRSPFVISIADLPRHEGAYKQVTLQLPAPTRMGVELLAVPQGEPIALDLQLHAVSEGVLVHGTVRAQAQGECARCLRDIERDVREQLSELVYYPQRAAALAEEDDIEAEELPVIDSDHIDLEPLVRDALVLALPLQPLCKPNCAGLCPECGERWEDLPPDHHHDHFDPRFAALDDLAAQLLAAENSGE